MADRGLMTKGKSSFIGKSFNRIKKMQLQINYSHENQAMILP